MSLPLGVFMVKCPFCKFENGGIYEYPLSNENNIKINCEQCNRLLHIKIEKKLKIKVELDGSENTI